MPAAATPGCVSSDATTDCRAASVSPMVAIAFCARLVATAWPSAACWTAALSSGATMLSTSTDDSTGLPAKLAETTSRTVAAVGDWKLAKQL